MPAGRKPLAPTVQQGPEFVTATPLDIVAQEHRANEILRGEDLVMNFEEVHRQLGQIEAFEFTRRVGDVAMAQIFENLRNSGKYKGLPYKDEEGNTRQIGSLDELCRVKLGKSYNRCLELSQNIRLLGPELYEQSERLGLRNIDYKALRALPSEEQALVTKAIEENQSRDSVLEILQELVSRHQHERETLKGELATKEAETAKAHAAVSGQIAAKDRLIADSKKRIAELVEEKNKREGMTDIEREEALEARLAKATLEAVTYMFPIRATVDAIRGLEHVPQGLYVAMQAALHRVITEAESIATDYGISLDFGLPTLSTEDAFDAEALADLDDPNADEDFGPDYQSQ